MGVRTIGNAEEFTRILAEIGMKRNVAGVLVFLANTPKATSGAIMQGTGLGSYEARTAVRHLMDKGWIQSREGAGTTRRSGRPAEVYRLVKPFAEIIDSIGRERTREAVKRLQLIRKLRDYPL